MTTSQSKKHSSGELKRALIIIAASVALVFPLLQFILSVALFAVCGVLVIRRLNAKADIIEQLTVGVLLGLTAPALIIYNLNMFLGIRVGFLSIMLALLFIVLLLVLNSFRKNA